MKYPLRTSTRPRRRRLGGWLCLLVGVVFSLVLPLGASPGVTTISYFDVVMADAPYGYWRLGEAAPSTVAADSSGNGFHGSYLGVTQGMPGAIEGDSNTAVEIVPEFDQFARDEVWIGRQAEFHFTESFTVEAWINASYSQNRTIVGFDDGYDPQWKVYIAGSSDNRDGRIGFYWTDGEWEQAAFGPFVAADDETWHHVVVARDVGVGVRMYIDGVEAATTEQLTPAPPPRQRRPDEVQETEGFSIGDVARSSALYGQIDEVAIYQGGLSAARALAHFQAGAPSYQAPPPEIYLSDAEQAEAVSITNSDSRIEGLTAGRNAAITRIAPWSKVSSDQKIGAVVTLSWEVPATITYAWPLIKYDETETSSPPYQEGTSQFTADFVTALEVLVDIGRDAVVAIEAAGPTVAERESGMFYASGTSAADEDTPENTAGRPTRSLRQICVSGDCFFNYDFGKRGHDLGPRWDRVDWPITLIWHGNADVDKARDVLNQRANYYSSVGRAPQWFRINDNNGVGWVWDVDHGSKNAECPVFDKAGYTRTYGDPADSGGTDSFFNLRWSYYVLGTTHFDARECSPFGWGTWHGKSELVEEEIVRRILRHNEPPTWQRLTVVEDAFPLRNAERSANRGRYRLLSNGWATTIHMP